MKDCVVFDRYTIDSSTRNEMRYKKTTCIAMIDKNRECYAFSTRLLHKIIPR